MKYRPEIDGLRAVAVLPVIFAHAKFSWLSGGFVGVDIFFVISGYLISTIIYDEAIRGDFSLVRFYERRARRIVPALAVVIVACLVAAHFLMLPESYENFGQSVVATLLFSNNILLTITSGYWELASEFKPLLHTWSLGIEEQFYIFYPLLVLAILKYRAKAFPAFLALGMVASFAMSVCLTPSQPNASFYMLHTRAWELLLGALCAYCFSRQSEAKGHQVYAGIGIALILASITAYSGELPYPYFYAAMPCLGTALVLAFAQRGTYVAQWLSNRLFVGIGLVSYSAYLWHQPLFAFARIASIHEPSRWIYGSLCLVTFVLAYLSWKYVEQPFRNKATVTRNQVFAFSVVSSLLLVAAGLTIYKTNGFPNRVPGFGLGGARYIAYNEGAFKYKRDAFTAPTGKKLLVVGNSTARDMVNIIVESRRFRDYEIIYRDDLTFCGDLGGQPHADLIFDADAIVVVMSWRFNLECPHLSLDDPRIQGKPIAVIGPKHFGYNLNSYIRTPLEERPKVRVNHIASVLAANENYRSIVPQQVYVDLLELFNKRFGGVPVFDKEGKILSADHIHVTPAGATLFSQVIFDDPVWKSFGLQAAEVQAKND